MNKTIIPINNLVIQKKINMKLFKLQTKLNETIKKTFVALTTSIYQFDNGELQIDVIPSKNVFTLTELRVLTKFCMKHKKVTCHISCWRDNEVKFVIYYYYDKMTLEK